MPPLADYYRDLLIWEGVEFRSLVDIWPVALIAEVKSDFIHSVGHAHLKGSQCLRVLRLGGHVAFEVGEVRGGKVQLEHHAIAAGQAAGLEPVLVLINDQKFTKTANCWGVDNNTKGANTNRVVLFRKL